MRPGVVLKATSILTGTPVVVLLVLSATGLLAFQAAAAGILVTLVASFALALVWARDLDLVFDVLRRAMADTPPESVDAAPTLPSMERLRYEIERLGRQRTVRMAGVEAMRRADDAIVEQLPDPLIVLGADRSWRRSNAAARSAFGADIHAVLRHPDLRAAIDRAFASSSPQTAAIVLPVPSLRDVHASVIPIDPPLSDGGRAVIVLSDRTREHAVERMRADFVANASHELRTPLASMIGFVDTLLGPAADDLPAQRRFLGIMAEQGARMNRLIDDLLSLSRVELVEHEPPSQRVDFSGLVEAIAAGFEPRLRDRAVTLDLNLDRDLPSVVGDSDQLAQVVQNLVDNAVKYGRDGGVIRIRVTRAPAGQKFPARPGCLLVVIDEGRGIAREHLPRLTERFYRVDKGRSRNAGGTGLGLAIVRHIVNRHRGQLLIESDVGHGTTITVWLPLAPVPPVALPQVAPLPADTGATTGP